MTTAQQLLDLCRRHIDPHAEPLAQYAGHDHTGALRAATRDGEVIVKVHRGRERQEQERHAYHRWVPALGERAPRLLVEIDDPPAIIVTALPGGPVAEFDSPSKVEQEIFGQAGALLSAWHRAEPARDTPNMTAWLADRGERWLALAEPILPTRERADIRAHLRDLAALGSLPAVPCHLDFTPHNLLYDPDGTVRIIDFEHARYDLAARDLVRLTDRIWRQRRDLQDAFLARYGALSELDRHVIEHCTRLDALTCAVRATGRALPVGKPT
ncbi:MAG: phosphotransferase enzyme family protein [Pseudonocardia sp.]